MAFCGKCGSQVNDGLKFCPYCGGSLGNGGNPAIQMPPNQQPNVSQNGSNKTLIAILGIVAATIVVIVLIVVLFVYPGVLNKPKDTANTETKTEESSSKKKEKSSSKEEESSSEPEPAETSSSSSSAEKAETAKTPRGADLKPDGPPAASDFSWVNEYVNTDYMPTDFVQDTSELAGSWKGYIAGDVNGGKVYDGVERTMNVEITDNDGNMTMTIDWYQFIAEGNPTDDTAGTQTYTATVHDGDSKIFFDGTYEDIELGTFYYEGGSERGLGVFTFSDGAKSYFAIMRP